MRRAYASSAMLVAALFALALAVAGLAVGVVDVPCGFELGPFAVAVAAAVAAVAIAVCSIAGSAEGPSTHVRPETLAEALRRFRMRRRRPSVGIGLLAVSLVAGAWVAVARSGADVADGDSAPVVVHASTSDGPLPIVGLMAVGLALALVAALLWGARWRRAAAAGTAVVGTAAIVSALGHLSFDPHFEVTPTLKIDRATLLALQRGAPGSTGSPLLAVRLRVAVQPPRLTVQLPARRSLTLLSFGGLRVSLAPQGSTVPCDCGRDLADTP